MENSQLKVIDNTVSKNIDAFFTCSRENIPQISDALILIKINTNEDFKQFQAMHINYPRNYYICLVSNKKKDIIINLISQYTHYILFLPFKREELYKILSRIIKEDEARSIKIQFYNGMQYFKHIFSWKTNEINISHTACLLSDLLLHMNLFKTDFEEENTRLGIEEILINAVEHGNLELNSIDRCPGKNGEDSYEEIKKIRFNEIKYCQRLILVELELKGDQVYITIEDEGPGFDTSKAENIIEGKTGISDTELKQPIGKGFWIVKNLFDSIKFEKNGRRVILEKKIYTA